MSRFTRFFGKLKKKKKIWNMGKVWAIDAIALFSQQNWTPLTVFHAGFGEITFLKWYNVSNLNSWFLEILNGFSSIGLPLFKLIFFIKIKKWNLTKIDISCQILMSESSELDPSTHQLVSIWCKLWEDLICVRVIPYQKIL